MKAHEVIDYLYEKHPALRDEQLAAAIARAERAEAVVSAIARAERAEAVVSAIPWQSLLNIYESATVSDRDEDALGAFLGVCIPASVFNSESEG